MNLDINNPLIQSNDIIEIKHITALCGQNSSGKSTVLRALEAGDVEVADYIEQYKDLQVFPLVADKLSILDTEFGEEFNDARRRVIGVLQQLYWRPTIVRSKSNEQIVSSLQNAVQPLRRYVAFDIDKAMESLTSILPKMPSKRKTVPAKRKLVDGVSIVGERLPNLNGDGIIEHLFRLQNHRTDRVGMRLLEKLENVFEAVTGGYKFEIDFEGQNLFLYFKKNDDALIGAENCGLGLQDALIMLYACVIDDAEWLLIEEPENHIHPSMQRELLRYFATVEDKTFFLATHSSVMLDQTYVDTILQCAFENGKIVVTDATSKSAILANLGYSVTENLTADVILMVEGPHDKEAVEEIIHKLGGSGGKTVRIWLLGGDIMDKQDFEAIRESFNNVRVLIDREANKASQLIRDRVRVECIRLNIPCTVLDGYAIENYYSIKAYQAVFPDFPPDLEALDPDTKVEAQIGFSPKKSTRQLVRETSIEDLQGTDLLQFVLDALPSR